MSYDNWKSTTPEDEYDESCERSKREQLRIQSGFDKMDDDLYDGE